MKLIARKALTYNTRHMQPGDPFEAPGQHARILIALKKAKEVVDGQFVSAVPRKDDESEFDALRVRAASLGIEVDGRWGAKRIAKEIDEASHTASDS